MNFEFRKEEFRDFIDRNFKSNIGKAIKVASISIILMILVSIITIVGIKFIYGDFARVNIFSILLTFHLSALKVKNMMVISIGTIRIGIIILLLMPMIILAISNFIVYRRKIESIEECVYESIKIAFVYGLFLSIIAIFSKIRINMGIDAMFGFGFNNSTTIGYKMLYSFTNGFIIAFITSLLLNWKKEFYGIYYSVDIISDVLKVFIKIAVILFIFTLIVKFTKNYAFSDFNILKHSTGFGTVAYIVQIVAYLMIIASGGSIEIGSDSNTVSIFKIFSGSTFIDTKLVVSIVFCVFAIAMIFVGNKIYKNYKYNDKKSILHFSIVYSTFIALVSRFSTISLSTSSMQNFSSFEIIAKSNSVSVFLITFIFSMIFIEIGHRVSKEIEEYL